ncbi:MAG: amylo-alpha-1,6-glucosidase [Elainellaceae cyanobacterium]
MDTREWLITNGTGSFASGTVADAHTRTYHGWLIASLQPPSQRTLLLSHIEASLYVAGQAVDLGCNFWTSGDVHPKGFQYLQSFSPLPAPKWVWAGDNWQISRQIIMPFGLTQYVSIDDFCDKKWQQQTKPSASPDFASGKNPSDPPQNSSIHPSDTLSSPVISNRVLIRYTYQGSQPAILTLRPLIGDRSFHRQQRCEPGTQFSQLVNTQRLTLQAIRPNQAGTPWTLSWTQGIYYPDGVWYWNVFYPEETRRGLGDTEDLYSPGYLVVTLEPGTTVTLEAAVVGSPPSVSHLDDETFDRVLHIERSRSQWLLQPLRSSEDDPAPANSLLPQPESHSPIEPASTRDVNIQSQMEPVGDPNLPKAPLDSLSLHHLKERLWQAGDRFIVYRQSVNGASVLAGYPWFSDWGRDAFIALPGLALTTGRFALARDLLQTFSDYCDGGLMPNAFPNRGFSPTFNNLDVSLWWVETLGLYIEASQDWDFLVEQYPTVQRIYKNFTIGTLYNVHIDASDGLLTWDAPGEALTWMDVVVEGEAVTPRLGKAIEINGLWYSMLCWAEQWAQWICENTDNCSTPLLSQGQRYGRQAAQVKESLNQFWNSQRGYFYDCIGPDDEPDHSIRPNALIALSLSHCGFSDDYARRALLVARDRLLTPYGLRSLDRAHPAYRGKYVGNVYARDRAYHQGVAWSWLIGPFIRAWQRFYPDDPLPVDGRFLLDHFQHQGGFDSISEIFDGDDPHAAQGAIAQAWSVAEMIRHWDDIFPQS